MADLNELVEGSSNDIIDHSQLIEQSVFLGLYPFEVITESIDKQFTNYIDMDDKVNYVDIFYNQLYDSYQKIHEDDGEEFPVESKEVLDSIYNTFKDHMRNLFYNRLTISIPVLENEDDSEDVEFLIRRLYEFFILGAKDNFKSVISIKLCEQLKDFPDDNSYFNKVNSLLEDYSSIITVISAEEFLNTRGDKEMIELFTMGAVNGNFLRKYSCKLYQNEEFKVDLINYITMVNHFENDIKIMHKEELSDDSETTDDNTDQDLVL
jgi:hypothetical protein